MALRDVFADNNRRHDCAKCGEGLNDFDSEEIGGYRFCRRCLARIEAGALFEDCEPGAHPYDLDIPI